MEENRKRLFDEWLLNQGTNQVVKSVFGNAQTDSELYTLPPLKRFRGSPSNSEESEQRSSPQRVIPPPPQFYFPNGPPPSAEQKQQCISIIDQYFSNAPDGFKINDADAKFKTITKELCQLPSFFSKALFRKMDIRGTGVVTRGEFIKYWIDGNLLTMDTATKVYRILKQPGRRYLSQDDFMPILQELLETHPFLEMLKESSKTQKRYAETVIYRIFYHNNIKGNGRLTLRELKLGNLIASMELVDEEQDIDEDLRYFSYKHFFVIFCTFGNVDYNHDFLIEQEDLLRYAHGSLTSRIVERIFSQAPRRFTSRVEGKMNYGDFVYFLLSEVDKSSEPSIQYWFKCLYADENEVLTPGELQVFFEAQRYRILNRHGEPMSCEAMFCEMVDMIAPERPESITLGDLKRSKLSGQVFNLLFNSQSWIAFRSEEASRQRLLHPDWTEWDHFAQTEYDRMFNNAEVLPDSDDEI